MNKKGFTIVEVVLSFVLIVLILASLTIIVINYRDKVTDEEVKTQMLDFKNMITKIVYDDIVRNEYTSLSPCSNDMWCVQFNKRDGTYDTLKRIVQSTPSGTLTNGVYLEFKNIKYFLPDSDLNTESQAMVDINEFILHRDLVNNLYKVQIPIEHIGMGYNVTIELMIS